MRKILLLSLILSVSHMGYGQMSFIDPETGNVSPLLNLDSSYELEFSDEFNDSIVNPDKWSIDVSQKTRTPRPDLSINQWFWVEENVAEGDGNLILKVTKADEETMHCGSIISVGKYERTYGYYESRIKIAEASKGTHTAFWLQGIYQGNVNDSGSDGAEIDIFESAWLGDFTKAVLHIDGYGAGKSANTMRYETPGIHEGFHTYGFYWTQDSMNIYYDGEFKVQYTGEKWVVQEDEYLWLSDGASFGFGGDNFTREPLGFLTEAYVDYIRVWRGEEIVRDSVAFGLEVECADTRGFDMFYGEEDGASNGYFIEVNPAIETSSGDVPLSDGRISYDFDVVTPQPYEIWARVSSSDTDPISFFRSVNNAEFQKVEVEITAPGEWVWVNLNESRKFYLNQGTNNIRLAYDSPNMRIDKLWMSNRTPTLVGTASGALSTCDVDLSLNGKIIKVTADTLSIEAEKGIIEGASQVDGCINASNTELVNLKNNGGVSFNDISVITPGEFVLSITYLTSGDRMASLSINGSEPDTITYASSGKWCFEGGGTAVLQQRVVLNKENNTIAIKPIGNGPHIDKITLEKYEEVVPEPQVVSVIATTNEVEEGQSFSLEFSVDQNVTEDQRIKLSFSGMASERYRVDKEYVTIVKDSKMATLTIETIDNEALDDDASLTVLLDSLPELLKVGDIDRVTISVNNDDTAPEILLSADNLEEMTIYPTVATDRVNVSSSERLRAVTIIDATGKSHTDQVNWSQSSIDVSSLKSGMYTIVIISDAKEITKRFFKK